MSAVTSPPSVNTNIPATAAVHPNATAVQQNVATQPNPPPRAPDVLRRHRYIMPSRYPHPADLIYPDMEWISEENLAGFLGEEFPPYCFCAGTGGWTNATMHDVVYCANREFCVTPDAAGVFHYDCMEEGVEYIASKMYEDDFWVCLQCRADPPLPYPFHRMSPTRRRSRWTSQVVLTVEPNTVPSNLDIEDEIFRTTPVGSQR